MDIEVGISGAADAVDARVRAGALPAGDYAVLAYRATSMAANRLLLAWVHDQGLIRDTRIVPGGEAFESRCEIHLTDPRVEKRKTQWVVELASSRVPDMTLDPFRCPATARAGVATSLTSISQRMHSMAGRSRRACISSPYEAARSGAACSLTPPRFVVARLRCSHADRRPARCGGHACAGPCSPNDGALVHDCFACVLRDRVEQRDDCDPPAK